MIQPLKFINKPQTNIPKIDDWKPENEQDILFSNMKNIVLAPISKYLRVESESLDCFIIRPKKCYNSQVIRDHLCQVINYFEKYFDPDKELFACMSRVKYMIDFFPNYSKENFLHDVRVYILGNSLKDKVVKLTEYNYTLDLTYKNISAPLQYTNEHAKTLLNVSIFMNFTIPLITHFAYKNRIGEIDEFILDVYDVILNLFPVDVFSKLFETSHSNVVKSEYKNAPLWAKQDIRGKDVVSLSRDSVDNIILNIMPKYSFNQNIVALNYTSIQKNAGFQITDISYEFDFVPLSSSKRDTEDNVSEFDKFEMDMIKQNESIYIQNRVNCEETMKLIEAQFGPFDEDEIEFYRDNLKNDSGNYINNFQKQLIFNLFYKYFGDTQAIYSIRPATDYIKLMLAAKKILTDNHMVILPYIISGKVEKIVSRKTINKKEEKELMSSQYYNLLVEKYRNPDVIQQILSLFATVISSNFRIIDYNNPEIHGKMIETIPSIIMEELELMALLV